MDYKELFTLEDRSANALVFRCDRDRGALVRSASGKLLDVVTGDGRSSSGETMCELAVRWPQFGGRLLDQWGELTGERVQSSWAMEVNVSRKEFKRLAALHVDGMIEAMAVYRGAYLRANEREALTDGYELLAAVRGA